MQHEMRREKCPGEKSGRSVVPEFLWNDLVSPRNLSVHRPRFDPGTIRIQMRRFTVSEICPRATSITFQLLSVAVPAAEFIKQRMK